MKNVDVLIIGAGPAGSTVAKEIARNGFSTCIVEKDSFPGENKVCGGCVSVSDLPLEIPENVVEKKIYGCKNYFSWGGEKREQQVIALIFIDVNLTIFWLMRL